jgi:hypothetical protein
MDPKETTQEKAVEIASAFTGAGVSRLRKEPVQEPAKGIHKVLRNDHCRQEQQK